MKYSSIHGVYCSLGDSGLCTNHIPGVGSGMAGYSSRRTGFAGGTVVHINSGVAGLVAAYMLGKRTGFRP